MKILFVSEYFPPHAQGGGEQSMFLLGRELVKAGISVDVLTSHFPGLKTKEDMEGMTVYRRLKTAKSASSLTNNLKRHLSFEKSLLKELGKIQKYDLLHCFNTTSIAAAKIKKKPMVLHVNSPVLFCPKGTLMYKDKEICTAECTRKTYLDCILHSQYVGKVNMPAYLKYNPAFLIHLRRVYEQRQGLLQKFDHYMPISTYMEKRLRMAGIRNADVIYNITDLDEFLNLSLPQNKAKKILYLGTYSRAKGPQILLEALETLDVPYQANFYGKGPLKTYLKQRETQNIHINDAVPYEKVPEILQEHDILVFPSLVGEAFGRSALEACAAGKTVIASDIGGVPDIVDEDTGFLFTPGNVNELRGLLEEVIQGKKAVDPQQVRKTIKKRFSNERTVKRVIEIYENLAS